MHGSVNAVNHNVRNPYLAAVQLDSIEQTGGL